jgi:polysaccharide export outer membrane protein
MKEKNCWGKACLPGFGTVVTLAFCLFAVNSLTLAQQRRINQSGAEAAASNRPADQAGDAAPGVLADTVKDYVLAPGDAVEISIEDAPELSHTYRVSAAGTIEMKIVGKLLVKQKTTEELAHLIATGLKAEGYLQNPNVLVAVKGYNSQTFFIQGAIGRPGVYQIEGRPPLLRMISLAGGLNENHGATAYILRAKPQKQELAAASAKAKAEVPLVEHTLAEAGDAGPALQSPAVVSAGAAETAEPAPTVAPENPPTAAADYELIRVNLSALYKGHFEQNYLLEPGDIVNIPVADVFFVAGEVNAPGSFPLKAGTTLRQAISLAQGTTFKAKAGRGVIFREDPESGQRQEIKVDIGKVLSGKQDDVPIFPNDVVIVPNSRTKSISSAFLTALGVNSARLPIRY